MLGAALAILEDEWQRNELETFYKENKKHLFAIAKKHLHNDNDIEDVIQEVFLDIANKPDTFFSLPNQDKIRYVNVVTRNLATDMFKLNKKNPTEELDEDIPYDEMGFEDFVIGNVAADLIKQFIKNLPTTQRDVIFLHCLLKLTLEETAEKLNVSVSAVKKYLRLGRKAVSDFLQRRNDDE